MKKSLYAAVLAVVVAMPLAGCGTPQIAGTVGQVASAVSPAIKQALAQKCTSIAPLLQATTNPAAPVSVKDAGSFGISFCAPIINQGVLPPTTDSNSLPWLGQVESAIKVAAQLAAFALPLL